MLIELSAATAADCLVRHGWPASGWTFSELGGGISNKVVLAESPELRAVLKQSLGQLRTAVEWRSDRERIFREAAALRFMCALADAGGLHGGRIPRLLFEDPESFSLAMEAAPRGAEMWKTRLFRGERDAQIAAGAGALLGSIIAGSWQNLEAERLFGDQTVFDQLRIDPSYRFTATRRPDIAEYNHALIAKSAARRVSLVHGDWSPKNLLAGNGELWAIDWEVIHYGDPSFDVGFLLNHLVMKSIAMPASRREIAVLAGAFISALTAQLPVGAEWIVPAALEHVPALLMARVAGKSPAEYLDAAMQARAESLALDLMQRPAASYEELFAR